jgi:Nuclease A inhibitor-like protein
MNVDLLTDLYYPSESDEPIGWITFVFEGESPLTIEQLRIALNINQETLIVESTTESFWLPITQKQDWFGDFELEQLQQFQDIKTQVDAMLVNQQVFRINELEVDLLLIGQVSATKWAGLKTKLIES